jgi:DNA (cytosine-5)-methyltransferase 1
VTREGGIDLFAGPGGWDLAARAVGLPVLGIEYDADTCTTRRAAGLPTIEADVRTVDRRPLIERFLDLIGSPPCQTFSASGKGHGRRALAHVLAGVAELADRLPLSHEHDDERTALVLEPLSWALQAVDAGLPFRAIVLEQVPSVLPVWQAYAAVLRREGYSVIVGLLGTEEYGVPQTRTRAVLIARRDGTARLPRPTHRAFVKGQPSTAGDRALRPWMSIADALGWTGAGRVGFPRLADTDDAVELNGARYRARDFRDLDEPSFALTGKARSWLRFGMRGGGTEQLHRSTDAPAPTLAFGRDSASWCWADEYDPGVRTGVEVDRISLADAGVLQTFPADYPWHGRSRHSRFGQVGNAVPPLFAEAILREALGLADAARREAPEDLFDLLA